MRGLFKKAREDHDSDPVKFPFNPSESNVDSLCAVISVAEFNSLIQALTDGSNAPDLFTQLVLFLPFPFPFPFPSSSPLSAPFFPLPPLSFLLLLPPSSLVRPPSIFHSSFSNFARKANLLTFPFPVRSFVLGEWKSNLPRKISSSVVFFSIITFL